MSSVVSARTGSDVSIDDFVWGSGTGDSIGCVSPAWTGGVEYAMIMGSVVQLALLLVSPNRDH